uniref:Eukaryotic translation initiation factor 2A n=1 Tax=Alexandrium catenella TaxID=2925 RepID=A0A7S1S9P7_ALECA|mmetsp:Transcript_9154/g.24806  ORF Transcript_9154/g.24806 Transcript_9154/m.24806 type:complete len:641 (+) Transcript_9154:62-1984(+)
MEFLAATKEGIFVYDALSVSKEDKAADWTAGHGADGLSAKVVAKLPSPTNAFGHSWSADGAQLASVCDDGVRIYDASAGYSLIRELPKVAPDVGGRTGGVRTVQFSAKNNFMVTYEKWDPQYPENVHCWALSGEKAGSRLLSVILKGYSSGALPVEMITWTFDEANCLILQPGVGIAVRDGDPSVPEGEEDEAPKKLIAEKSAGNFVVAPAHYNGACFVACYIPEGSLAARVAIYSLSNTAKSVAELHLPAKVKDCKILWNFDGTAVLVLASSDVDETGSSYFGTTYLYWVNLEGGKAKQTQIYGAKDGQVQDLCWSPTANEFMVVVGMLPATVALHDGKTGKQTTNLGQTRRNTLKWNPFGRFVAVGGFGTLPGDLDFFDRSKEETISSLRAALTVNCDWAPDGRHFITATVAPRMNEGNQMSIYRYTGERIIRLDYVPEHVEARHEDTGAGARTKTQALLYAVSWRPDKKQYEDRAASPPRPGNRRKKGLPDGSQAAASASAGPAYRPKGTAGGSVAAMMRGEMDAPAPSAEDRGRWESNEQPKLADWEIKKMERERRKEAEKRVQEDKDREKQELLDCKQAGIDGKKRIKELKKLLEEIEAAKDKDWDEQTDDDEALMEKEVDYRTELAELEKKHGS